MTQKDKELLLKDLCARLPYGIMITMGGRPPMRLEYIHNDWDFGDAYCMCSGFQYEIEECKPYLRPLSSMTEDEFVYFMGLRGRMLQSYEIQSMMKEALNMPQFIKIGTTLGSYSNKIDWLNRNHFDYRGLIERGLAIEVTEDNNPYKD